MARPIASPMAAGAAPNNRNKVEPKIKWTGNEFVGIVIETGVYAGNKDTKVLWEDGRMLTYKSKYMDVINA